MRLSLAWLGEHLDLRGVTAAQVGELLTLHAAEVESVEIAGGGWPGVTVARVVAVRPHPNADRLRLVKLETGGGEAEVVCGAPNVAAGQKVCFAPEGTTLPGGLLLTRRKIRGVESAGMVLSARELALGDDHDGILVLDAAAPVGAPVAAHLEADAVLTINNTAIATRPDLWGHRGVARELAAILERELRPCAETPPESAALGGPQIDVSLRARNLCPRYLGWAIGGVNVEPSPDWLRRRLEAVGQRSINNLVDLTNFVMLDCGQPLHAFDRRRVARGTIVVREARSGERVVTLDGTERLLPPGCCVIADPERALAVAGVMGLQNSEVVEETTEIVLEVANFEMTSIRAASKALGLRTESASRFEKGLDPEGIPQAALRFLALLRRVCPTAQPLGGPRDVRAKSARPRRITLPAEFIPSRLGIGIPADRVDAILSRLGFVVQRTRGRLKVTVPTWRAGCDVAIPEDLVEEVGRIHGYDRIEPLAPRGTLEPLPEEPARARRRLIRGALSGPGGMTEIYAYPFTTAEACAKAAVAPGTLGVANAAQRGLDFLAPSHLPALLRAGYESLKYRTEVSLYLVAPVFARGEGKGLPLEREALGLFLRRASGGNPALEMKGAVEILLEALRPEGVVVEQAVGPGWLHPGRSARLARGEVALGWFGELHPAVAEAHGIAGGAAAAELDLEAVGRAGWAPLTLAPISRFPPVPYDVAVVVERRTPAALVETVLRRAVPGLVRSLALFDVYEGSSLPPGMKSLAFTVTFGAMDRTLGGADVEGLRRAVGEALARQGWTLRA
ncbi:MAG: phenylalanine--tRNA ligase subunit beta [Planctomycetaceae bacterium]